MQRKYSIAMIAACPFPTVQGSQVYIGQLSEALARRGHEVKVITYHFGENGYGHTGFSVPIYRIPRLIPYRNLRAGPSWRKPLLDVLLVVRTMQVVKKNHVDILHAHNYEAALVAAIVHFLTGIPVVFNTHGVMADELHTYFKWPVTKVLAGAAARVLDGITARLVQRIIAISPGVKDFFVQRGIAARKVYCIPPGITYPASSPEDVPSLAAIQGPIIFYTGNLDNYQNVPLLLESFVSVAREKPDARLVFVTHCDTRDLEKQCREFGIWEKIVILPHIDFHQVQAILARARVAVLPRTAWSGFPIKLLNYMAAGKAIVACEGSAKAIDHLQDGMVVKNGDVNGFAEAVLQLLDDEDLCRRLGEAARKKAETIYSWDTIVKQVESLYAELLGVSDDEGSVSPVGSKNL